MKKATLDNGKLGLFVIAGLIFMVFTLYMIGKNRDLLGSTFTVRAVITNVNGLVSGNNVRFKGIDVGTVKSIEVRNDTAIMITMTIDDKMKPFIRKNAIVSIGTDGLMGNKLININSLPGHAGLIEKGDVLASLKPIETDEMLRTLNTTNNNIERITANLFEITTKLNSSKSLWSLLSDTVVTQDLKTGVASFKRAGIHSADFTKEGKELVAKLDNGNGLVQKLFTDTVLSTQLTLSIRELQAASRQTNQVMNDLKTVAEDLRRGHGTAGLLLSDTTLRKSLVKSVNNVEEGTGRFNQNMEAMKSHFLFRGYFKKLEREAEKNAKDKKN